MFWVVLQAIGILLLPLFAQWVARKAERGWMSPVVLCYAMGIVLANTPGLPLQDELSSRAGQVAILLAIPLLLFSTRLLRWIRFAGPALFSFALAVLAAGGSTLLTAWWWQGRIDEPATLAGMLAGLYSGGTPNMQAVGIALGAPETYLVLLNAADIILGGSWLIFLMSASPAVMGLIFRPFPEAKTEPDIRIEARKAFDWRSVAAGLGFSALVSGLAAGLTFLLFGSLNNTAFLLLALTTLSLALSFWPFLRDFPGTRETGEYLLLVFSVAIGMLADLSLLASSGLLILAFSAVAKVGAILLHLLLARIFRIDRDTFLITNTAALYGPVFIPQMVSVLKNDRLLFAGMAAGLLGYAVGNYLGLGVAWWMGGGVG